MIVYSRDARHDIVRLRSFLSQSSPGAARRAMAQIFKAIDRLQNFPDRGHITKDANIRRI
jgi:toxin ParE1/3/4